MTPSASGDSNVLAGEDAAALSAGQWLVSVCEQRESTSRPPPQLTTLEQLKLDEFCTIYRGSSIFKSHHIEAVRICLSKKTHPDYQLVRVLLQKDIHNNLFVGETDILQVAIKSAKINPGDLGKSPKLSCPELIQVCGEVISHGASVDCLDSNGNSPLFYACVLGFAELFHFLVDNGARTSTLHKRSPPDQFGEKEKKQMSAPNSTGDAAEVEQMAKDDDTSDQPKKENDVQVNLLQITSDAILSPERVTDMTWWSFPPGLMMDRPLWKLKFNDTWPQIIIYLLEQSLEYEKSDPGLVYVLHVACAQGSVDIISKLLDFEIAIHVTGPQLKNMGAGRGRFFGSALHAAASETQLNAAKLLLARGGNPRARCLNSVYRGNQSPNLTPVQVAIDRYSSEEQIFDFLEYFIDIPSGLDEKDYRSIIKFGAELGQLDLVERLLKRGLSPPTIRKIRTKEMAQLLISYNVNLDAATIQKTALHKQRMNLLRWCVDMYGPLLPADPESWGKMVNGWMNCGKMYILEMQYLIQEYPGPHIDTVLSAVLRLPGTAQAEAHATSWLHMAALYDNLPALWMLLDAGADPSCPGLPTDVATLMRTSNYNHMRSINDRLEIVHILEKMETKDPQYQLASYTELVARNAERIELQRRTWNKRIAKLIQKRSLPVVSVQASTNTSVAAVPYLKVPPSFLPLGDSKSAFRLLEILPSEDTTAPLVGRMFCTDLTFQPAFEAISHVWGPAVDTESILLDHQKVSITPSIHAALMNLRSKEHVRTLWIDILCIQQSEHAERNQQVTIMGHIYRAAKQVIIWLGEEANNSHLVFAHVNEKPLEAKFFDHSNLPKPSPQQRSAWASLVTRPWFFRTWVIQEVALSRKATVMCGKDSAPWLDTSSGDRRDISGGGGGLSTVSSGPRSDLDHPLSGFDADKHAWRLRLLKQGSDAVEILRYSRHCQTTEPRDRIYGILGLFEPGFMRVDYNLPVGQIFREFTEAVIHSTGNLNVLTALGSRHSEWSGLVPSWVPNFVAAETGTVRALPQLQWYGSHRSTEYYTYRKADGTHGSVAKDGFPKTVLPGLAFREDGALVLNGKLLDTVRTLGPELFADGNCAPGTPAFKEVMEEWEHLSTELISDWNIKLGASVTLAFAVTLTASRQSSAIHSIEAGFAQWYRYCGTGVLEKTDPSLFLRNLEYYLWWLNVGKVCIENEDDYDGLGFDLSGYADQVEMACYGHRFFITENGSMGLAGPDVCAGDRIAFIPGADKPFVLRPREDNPGWTLQYDCYLYGFDPYALFADENILVDEFVIY